MHIAADNLDQQQLNKFSQVINDGKSFKENPLIFPDDIM
jgi:hypothetical protein